MAPSELGLIFCIFLAAVLYSSIGHAGASGYLAAMALFGVAPASMKPAALTLNILVATIASIRFISARAFSLKLFLPLAAFSIPFAFIGGKLTLPDRAYKVLVALALFAAAIRLLITSGKTTDETRDAPIWLLCAIGAGIGLLSGLTGVGGGIYLTPVILLAGWAVPKVAAGVSAAFILVNSISGLAGQWQASTKLPPHLGYWAAAAVTGGLIGSHLGVTKFGSIGLKRMLAAVLVIAAYKLAFT